ncbi:shikimate dehydrogenase [Halogeometricum sp. S1BR25-6]|uniref:Shikimate dehydrogenase (NADP(+)) n=1 Tax=Halogeometricum salsisoli TaxID=2950536 RepID=A0ABU2GB23_9EURY|nr:shikimate dehydrogenase [Halogeometricum sp. S1BR25-6]MDS0298006.1 shikimate dehydrogenase [Halogeometricum sp. S1BR25-6]
MQVFGLLGNPVGHSLSPPMHEAAYDSLGMEARYVTFEPSPEDLPTAVSGADALGIAGLNVTIPFKQEMVDLVEPDELAARIGAVNTVDFTGETPRGYNTDAAGVRRSFAHHDVPLEGTDAVVVGAGGAGRAASFALADAGASVHVANRTAERATELAADVRGATGGGLDTLDELAGADVLVNATSVGMESDETPVPADRLHGGLAVLDAVYAPVETRLLREAAAAGATTIDGAWMLLFQGVEAFERWTGRDAPVDAMNDALRANLG